jgi:hypothetical protein
LGADCIRNGKLEEMTLEDEEFVRKQRRMRDKGIPREITVLTKAWRLKSSIGLNIPNLNI